MARGNRKGVIFEDDVDRVMFRALLGEAIERYRLHCQSYCLMGNHYHAVVETQDANLSDAFQWLNGVFAHASNRRHDRSGHLWQGRFKSVLIGDDRYLRAANIYVVMNPVAAGLVAAPSEWKWSSFRASAGMETPQNWLNLDWLQWTFGGRTLGQAQRKYRQFVTTPSDEIVFEEAVSFGDQALEDLARSQIGATLHQTWLPSAYRALARPTLGQLFPRQFRKADRNTQILRAHVLHGYQLSEIAACLCVHPNTVSRVVRALRLQCAQLR